MAQDLYSSLIREILNSCGNPFVAQRVMGYPRAHLRDSSMDITTHVQAYSFPTLDQHDLISDDVHVPNIRSSIHSSLFALIFPSRTCFELQF